MVLQSAIREQSSPHLRVALVEDDAVIAQHFQQTINAHPDMDLAWHADTFASARRYLSRSPLAIDVVLLDLGLPDGSGVELIDRLVKSSVKVLVITVFDDRATVLNAVRYGAHGYLLKESSADEIVPAIRSVVSGDAPVAAAAAKHLTDALRLTEAVDQPTALPNVSITVREKEILQLFAKGLSYRAVAAQLNISRHTVGDFVKSIYTKLGVNSRSEAVYRALQNNLIEMPE